MRHHYLMQMVAKQTLGFINLTIGIGFHDNLMF